MSNGLRNEKVIAIIDGYTLLPSSRKENTSNFAQGQRNDKILAVIMGYSILRGRTRGEVFLRSPIGVNFSIPMTVLEKIVQRLQTDMSFQQKFPNGFIFLRSPQGVNFNMPIGVMLQLVQNRVQLGF